MAKVMRIKRGLTLNLKGKAPLEDLKPLAPGSVFAIVPDDFRGVVPKLSVHVGDRVQAGSPLMYHKRNPEMKFTSPVSGEVIDIVRGARRKILAITIRPTDGETDFLPFDTAGFELKSAKELKPLLLESGMWGFIRQRPYDIVADPDIPARDIFITAHFTAPLHPSFSDLAKTSEKEILAALKTLRKFTEGKIYVSVAPGASAPFEGIDGVECVEAFGPHPAGLVGTLINKTKPVNKGEVVWTLKASDLVTIGRFLLTGKVDFRRRIAITGSHAAERGYLDVMPGMRVDEIIGTKPFARENHLRVIAGDVFTGLQVTEEAPYFPMGCDMITIIPEGDNVHEFFGWATPGFGKFSVSRTFFSWMMPKSREYVLDARVRGGERAIIMSNEYRRVFPLDIYPEYLIKATIAFDITKMENLGIYEVAPEDFALCEFADTSKIELQRIIRQGLDELYKEMN